MEVITTKKTLDLWYFNRHDNIFVSPIFKIENIYIEKEGQDAAFTQFKEEIDKWRKEPVKLALTGKSGVGKSSFINAIRNMKPGNCGFATTSCSGNTTEQETVYKYPRSYCANHFYL
jgi:putative ribosome biogenesis GTPase RsgA